VLKKRVAIEISPSAIEKVGPKKKRNIFIICDCRHNAEVLVRGANFQKLHFFLEILLYYPSLEELMHVHTSSKDVVFLNQHISH